MKKSLDIKLQEEREKLNRLVDEALKNGTPLSDTQEIMKQYKKVNEIIMATTPKS